MKTTIKKLMAIATLCLLSFGANSQDEKADATVDCHCMAIDNWKVVTDECKRADNGFCFGFCEYKNKTFPWMIHMSWNFHCTDVADAPVGVDAKEFSLYNYNKDLKINIGSPINIEKELNVALNLEGTMGTVLKYDVVNSFGKTILSDYKVAAGSSTLKINTKDLAHGVYALKFEVNGQVINKNFVL